MSQGNPFAKFVPNPSSAPDPNKITLQQLEKYSSFEMERLGALTGQAADPVRSDFERTQCLLALGRLLADCARRG